MQLFDVEDKDNGKECVEENDQAQIKSVIGL